MAHTNNQEIIDNVYSKRFCFDLDKLTYKLFDDFAEELLKLRNEISDFVWRNRELYENVKDKSTFVKLIHAVFGGRLSSYYTDKLYEQIFLAYRQKFESLQSFLKYGEKEIQDIKYYKKKTVKKDKDGNIVETKFSGDVKEVVYKYNYETPKAKAITYFAKWRWDDTLNPVEYITNKLQVDKEIVSDDTKKKLSKRDIDFYTSILKGVETFGYDEIYKLAQEHKEFVYSNYKSGCIFKSKMIEASIRTTKHDFIILDKDGVYKMKFFIPSKGYFFLPIKKFSEKYHGNISLYDKEMYNARYTYRIELDPYECKMKVYYVIYGAERIWPTEIGTDEQIVGIDFNSADNLITTSLGTVYDYDRKTAARLEELIKYTEEQYSANGKWKAPKKIRKLIDELKNKLHKDCQRKIAQMVKDLKAAGIVHIICEDLDGRFGKSYCFNENNTNCNMVNMILELCSLKYDVQRSARKRGIMVSFVPSPYTSQECSVCHHIERGNRKQRCFDCLKCENESNADYNAAKVIKSRFTNVKLRERMLEQDPKTHGFVPKKIFKPDEVYEILAEVYNFDSRVKSENSVKNKKRNK